MKAKTSIKEILSTPEHSAWITAWLAKHNRQSRTDLTRAVCKQFELLNPKGALRIATTAKALRDLETQGFWILPAPGSTANRQWTARRLGHSVELPQGIPDPIQSLEDIQLVQVDSGDDQRLRIFNELILTEHPLHDARLVGRQLRYLIGSPYGWLGAIGLGASALYLKSRDQWIGWDESQRAEHHERVINLTRFLIRPSVRCENLASYVLGLCARRVANDFHRRYGIEPWWMETFVDPTQVAGTCFQAANWIDVGQTQGRGRNGSHKEGKSIKEVYLYPLIKDFRARMGVSQPRAFEPLALESALESDQWAHQEFSGCDLGDARRTAQLMEIAKNKAQQPSASYASACEGDRHKLKAYYRLINHPSPTVSSQSFMSGHRTQTIRRMANEKTALIIQDTMDMNFSARLHCEGLGLIGKNQTGTESQGLKMHSRFVLNDQGLPLGVLHADLYAAQPKPKLNGKVDRRPIEEKETYRWVQTYEDACTIASELPTTHCVCIGDRESDLFELFDRRRRHAGSVDLLVRAKHDRCLEEEEKKLFEHMAQGQADGSVSIRVPRQREKKGKATQGGRGGLPARTAHVEVRFQAVSLCAPKTPHLRNKKPITIYAIYLVEPHPPADATPIEWLLLTTVDVRSMKRAMTCVRWYTQRWRIEEWHRILKSGCGVLNHQNHSAETLSRAISVDVIVAWRIMLLALLGREVPDLPCDVLFNRWECAVLELLAQKKARDVG